MRSFCGKTHVHKILRFRGGVWGGGSADFIFMGARIFLKKFRTQAVKWVVAKLHGDKTASVCSK